MNTITSYRKKISNAEQLQLCVVDLNIKCHTILIDVAGWAAALSGDRWSDGFQETAAWNLTTEEVLDLKELFMIFDSDKDGVLTFTQVKNAIGVLGKPIRGEYLPSVCGALIGNWHLGILFRWRTVVSCEKVLWGYKELVSGVQRVSKNAGLSQKRQVCQKLWGTSCSLRVCTFVLHNNKQCIRTWTMTRALQCLHRHWYYSQYSQIDTLE